MLSLLLALASPVAVPAPPAPAPLSASAGLKAEIEGELADMVRAFDRRDLDAFMRSYSTRDDVRYVSGGHILDGGKAIRAEMEQFFAGPPQRLSFAAMTVTPLGNDHVLAVMRPRLTDLSSGKASFQAVSSLIFVREDGHWRILLDHTD